MSSISTIAAEARQASYQMAIMSSQDKDRILLAIKEALLQHRERIFEANAEDLERAEKNGLPEPIVARLAFGEHKLEDVTAGIDQLRELPDPIGMTRMSTELAPGLDLYRVTCPIGVIGIIFESRPDALVQISALCLKSGNAVLLKGGREAMSTNRVLAEVIREASLAAGCPQGWIGLLESHEDVDALLSCDKEVDLLIPRGSNAFVQYIMSNTRIPVLGHADGVCHTFIDQDADLDMALDVVIDAKTQYVSVCNATETILLHRDLPQDFIDLLIARFKEAGVRLHGDEELAERYQLPKVSEWHHEYLDMAASVHLIEDLHAAVDHINAYGSGHTDAILTTNEAAARYFMNRVDSGNVFWNCSTRFSDGFRYGFGAEVGVSTSKIHARGPVGLEGLVTYKYKVIGHGDKVADFASGKRAFTHRPLGKDCPY